MTQAAMSQMIQDGITKGVAAALAQVQPIQQVSTTAPSVEVTKNGKIHIGTPVAAPKGRKDERDPRTIITIGKDSEGKPVTLGYSKTYGFGVQIGGTMIFHKSRKWMILAQIAPIVAKAISEKYES